MCAERRVVDIFVPGRVCLLGEHSDWAAFFYDPAKSSDITHGRCLAYGLPIGIYNRASAEWVPCAALSPEMNTAEAAHTISITCRTSTDDVFTAYRVPLTLDEARRRALEGNFMSCIFGTIFVVLSRYAKAIFGGSQFGENCSVHVDVLNYKTDLPVQKGLSSSAASCVTYARVFNQLFNLGLDAAEEMDIAYEGEIMTGSECGRLDQCVAYGPCCVDLHFEGQALRAIPLKLPPHIDLHFVVADLNAGKDTRRILRELRSCFPDHGGDAVKRNVQRFLGQKSLDHVAAACAAIEAGDAKKLGQILDEYQGAFDAHLGPACDELRSPKLHRVLSDPRVRQLSCGGKGVGSQGDGSVQFVCRNACEQRQLCDLLNSSDLDCHAMIFTLKAA